MVAAVRVHKAGGPEVLTLDDIEVPAPGPNQVKIKQHAIGVNFIDTYFRMGMYPSPVGMPFVAGNEGAGEVIAVGAGVTDIKVGDRVAYVTPLGAYAAERLLPADRAVKLPDNISYEQAAEHDAQGHDRAVSAQPHLQGRQGHHRADPRRGRRRRPDRVPVGQSSRRHRDRHRRLQGKGRPRQEERRHHTILYRDEDFVAKVKEITSGKLCDVVYDGIGNDTFPKSLDCIRPLGMFVSFGSASGPIKAFDINLLQHKGSLFATRPTLNHYAAKREDLLATAQDLFDKVGSGAVKIPASQTYKLKDAAQAHKDLEGRGTTDRPSWCRSRFAA